MRIPAGVSVLRLHLTTKDDSSSVKRGNLYTAKFDGFSDDSALFSFPLYIGL